MYLKRRRTELDARVLLADVVTLLVGEEHVGGETALGHVGVCAWSANDDGSTGKSRRDIPFFFLPPSALPPFLAPRVVAFSFGMIAVFGVLKRSRCQRQ